MRPPIRLAALMRAARRSTSSRTTGSALGEDGPTHQPVEQLAALRAIPNLTRASARATPTRPRSRGASRSRRATARRCSCSRGRTCRRSTARASHGRRAAARRVRARRRRRTSPDADPDRDRLGGRLSSRPPSGSRRRASRVRCVSMPCWELFEAQPQSYRDEVLPPAVKARLAVERGVLRGLSAGSATPATSRLDRFGASAPAACCWRIRLHRRRRRRAEHGGCSRADADAERHPRRASAKTIPSSAQRCGPAAPLVPLLSPRANHANGLVLDKTAPTGRRASPRWGWR